MREIRYLSGAQMRAINSGHSIQGYAAVWDQWSEDLGGFREKIQRGTFARAIRLRQDVRCLFNHVAELVLGRTTNGTLALNEDATGLLFSCDLPDTQAGRDVRTLVARGDVNQCSFGFSKASDVWNKDGTERTLLDVDLFDVSPVTYPAYQQTIVEANSARRLTGRAGLYIFKGIRTAPRTWITPVNYDPQLERERQAAMLRLMELRRPS